MSSRLSSFTQVHNGQARSPNKRTASPCCQGSIKRPRLSFTYRSRSSTPESGSEDDEEESEGEKETPSTTDAPASASQQQQQKQQQQQQQKQQQQRHVSEPTMNSTYHECSVCTKQLDSQVRCTLECHHSFCFACIDHWYEHRSVIESSSNSDGAGDGDSSCSDDDADADNEDEEERAEQVVDAESRISCPYCRAHRSDGTGWSGKIVFDPEFEFTDGAGKMRWQSVPI